MLFIGGESLQEVTLSKENIDEAVGLRADLVELEIGSVLFGGYGACIGISKD